MLAALVLPVLAMSSASANMLLNSRSVDDIWGGVNITKAALGVYDSVSSPTCNATAYCTEFVTKSVPRCITLQGTAGCWCTLHDPLHYCAICMSNPTDNTTTPDQTQLATASHADYHKGCGAWIAYINATATGGTLSSSSVPSSSLASSASTSSTALASTSSSKSSNTGAIVGAAIGGIAGLILLLALLFFFYRHTQNKAAAQRAALNTPSLSEKEFFDSRFSAAPSSGFIAAQHTARSDAKSTDTMHRSPPPPFQPNRAGHESEYDTSMLGGYPKQPEVMQ